MADMSAKSETLRGLSELLAERGDWPLKNRLALVRKLARQVQTLHQNGRIHRAIGIDAVGVDEQLRPHLSPPGAPRRFGGEDDCDPEFCPPELTGQDAVELPAEIDTAAAALQKAGYALDPRRVDVYQLGALLCRLATDGPVLSYIYDATIKARVSAVVRPLLERTLGLESPERWENCERLIEGLDEALRRAESLEAPTSMIETPARGSAIVSDDDTPPQGTQQPPPGIAEPLPFTRLGHYRIVERIGAGGMGDVYRGYDESLERPVAVKVLPSQLARDADFVRRFHAEATAAAGVAHPNVVPIYFIGEDAGHHFFAMQCIEGESLAGLLDRQGQFPVDEALELIGQCLAGLQAAHECGLIHRDIKPGNILLERGSGRAMLVDFGLVRRIGQSAQMTATGVIMGTVDYIAPEQARGRKVDARVDIYALGVLFYQLLSGRMPFTADSPTAMIFQHAYEEPFPLEEAVPGLPPPVAQIVERMMAKEPDHRYPDCGAALADVQAYRQGRPLASNESAWASGFEEESSPGGEPKLPEGLARLLDPGRVQVVRDWAATMFRRHAPEYVQQMQGTTQQLDAAVAHYRRRRNRLAKLLEEARGLKGELSGEQIEDLEGQLSKADATLARLRSQQNVLKARLQAAEANRQLEGGRPQPKFRRWLKPVAIGGTGLLGVALLMLLVSRSNVPTDSSQPVPTVTPSAVSPSVAAKPVPAVTASFSLCGTGLDSGGALLPSGTVDPNYTIVKAPSGFSPPLTPKVIHNVPTRGIPWARNTPISQWINPTGDGSQDLDAGSYIYQTTFDLSDFDSDTASIHGNWAADGAAKIYLNGRYTGISLPRRRISIKVLHPFSITSGFRAGTNTLDFHVTNGGTSRNPTGIHVQIARTTAAVVADRANVARHTSGATAKPEPAVDQPPKPNPKVPPGAALLMTFDKNTLLEVSGIIFRIRSLTGRNNGKDITALFTPDGKVGGAISIEDGSEVRIPGHIVNRQPEYTVAAWIKRKDNEHLWVYNENADGTIYNFEAQTNGSVAVRAWHKGRGPSPSYPGGNWMDAGTPEGLVPANQWVFVAARLVNGQVDRGQLTIRVNDRSYACEQQMVYHDSTQYASIGSGNGAKEDRTSGRGAGLVDELAVYPRALSDAEIETLYQMGLHGESLGM